MKKLLYILFVTFVLIITGGWYLLTHVAPYMILSPQRISLEDKPEDFKLNALPQKVLTSDSVLLDGYIIQPQAKKKGTMVLIHGIGGCKEHMISLAAQLSQLGFASLVFDLRAHGQSGGAYCTYGYYERKDIIALIDHYLKVQPAADSLPIGVWGNSLGGAIALQTMEAGHRIDFGIIESTFTALDQIVIDYQKRFTYGLGFKFLTDYSLKQAGKIAHFDPNLVKPVHSAKNIHRPVLIAHGDADQNISVTYGKQLYKALSSQDKELVIVQGGKHWGLFDTGGEKYSKQLFDFINKQTNSKLAQ